MRNQFDDLDFTLEVEDLLEQDQSSPELAIAMRIVSENAINPMAFLSDQCQSWMKNGGLDLGLIDQSTLMFYFEESEKLETVLKRAP